MERATVEVERTLFEDDWTGLSEKLDEALAVQGCASGNWINQLDDAYNGPVRENPARPSAML